jgi:NTP pyrophosphatase (non-canonical NTP hydrolase)
MLNYTSCGKEILVSNVHFGEACSEDDANAVVEALNTMENKPDKFDYVAEANVTLSNQFHGELVPLFSFGHTLDAAIAALSGLDIVKKSLFYGRPNNLSISPTDNYCELLPHKIAVNSDTMTVVDAEKVIHGIIGLATEAGELLELLRDTLNGMPLDLTNLKEEVGDGKWYMAILARAAGFVWGDDERSNIAKLRARFPNAFTEYDANNRNLDSERKILES